MPRLPQADLFFKAIFSTAVRFWVGALIVTAFGPTRAAAQPFAYVPNRLSANVSVIDTQSRAVVATIDLVSGPTAMAVTPDGAFAYVSHSNDVSVIDLASNVVVATVPVGIGAGGMAISPDGAFVYVVGGPRVVVIDTFKNSVVGNIIGSGEFLGVDFTPDGAFAYVANYANDEVTVIDTKSRSIVATVSVSGNSSWGIAISPDGAFAYVANQPTDTVSIISTASRTVVRTVTVGDLPREIDFTPDGAFAYVTNFHSHSVSVIDTASEEVVATIQNVSDPQGVGITPDGAHAYVTNYTSQKVSVFDTATREIIRTINVGSYPSAVVFTPIVQNPYVLPKVGGNNHSVAVRIAHPGMQTGAGVKLTAAGQPDIVGSGSQVVKYPSGNILFTSFDLRGASPGKRNVVISLPNGTNITLPDAFFIEDRSGQVTADGFTEILDHLDGGTTGVQRGPVGYVDGPPGMGRAQDFKEGSYIWYRAESDLESQATVELWLNPRRYGVGLVNFNWYYEESNPPGGHVFHLQLTDEGRVSMSQWPNSGCGFTSTSAIPLNQWTHIAVSWGTSTKIYINGVLNVSGPDCFHPAASAGPFVYLHYWGANDLGYIDEFHVSRIQRTDEEIRSRVKSCGAAADAPSIVSVLPNKAGNTGSATAVVHGCGFTSGSTVKLVRAGLPEIVGQTANVNVGFGTITTVFNLRGSEQGVWDVVVSNPDGKAATLTNGFTIEQGRAAEVWVDVIGRNVIRGGREQAYFLQYGNRGNVDSGPARFWIKFPSYLTWKVTGDQKPSLSTTIGENTYLAFDVSDISAGSAGAIPVRLTALDTPDFAHRRFEIRAWPDKRVSSVTFGSRGGVTGAMPNFSNVKNHAQSFDYPTTYSLQDAAAAVSCRASCRESPGDESLTVPPIQEGSDEDVLRDLLSVHGITIKDNQPPCPPGVRFCDVVGKKCLSVEGFRSSVTFGLIGFKNEFGGPLEISGGSECGHAAGPLSHADGYKVDLRLDNTLNNFIFERFDLITGSSNKYGMSSGPIFYYEGNPPDHWDVTFPDTYSEELTVKLEGNGEGSVTSDLQGIDCGTKCSQVFTKGIKVVLKAHADPESRFAGWVGASNEFGIRFDRAAVRVDADKEVIARFENKPEAPPDGNEACWFWNRAAGNGYGGWIWRCSEEPPDGGGREPRKPDNDLCWYWDECADKDANMVCRPGWIINPCPEEPNCPTGQINVANSQPDCPGGGVDVEIVTSRDPNDKVGSQGWETVRYVSGEEPLRYAIYFENKETATAPAQDVVITDQLELEKLDLNTFSLGHISFGDTLVMPPPGLSQFNTDVDLRPAKNLIVRINVSLNKNTGLLTWRFNSIDPDTGLPPEDPLAGFLPPNKNPPEGDGSVLFTVMPKMGLLTGTEVRNKARIIFDTNEPIDTPEWLNTLDNSAPTSHVLPLAPAQTSTTFNVQWAGTDVGSGVRDYTVYVSDNGEPFIVWLTQTTGTQAAFTGVLDHTYSFFSVARDLTNNSENIKTSGESTTRITPASCAVSVTNQVNVNRGGFRLNKATGRFVQEVTLQNVGGDSIQGAVSLVLDDLSSNATLFGASGSTTCAAPLGSPFADVNVGSDGVLSPGETATVVLEFVNPTHGGITYSTRVIAGSGNR